MKVLLITFLLLLLARICFGQYYQYSQYNFTDQRVNPALVAATDCATLSIIHRDQSTGGDFNIKSSNFSIAYPFLNGSNGKRWSGIGLSLTDDRSGGIYTIQEAALSYAMNIYVNRWQTISLGVKGLYQQQRINLNGLFTGMQYIPDRGFDNGLQSGEEFRQLTNNFFTLSLGGYWQQLDKSNNRIAYASFSFFDFNKPDDSFLETNSQLRGSVVAGMGFRIYRKGQFSIFPEALITYGYGNFIANIGTITQYEVWGMKNVVMARLDIITKYVPGRSGIIGLQLHKDNFSVGLSYDFPLFTKNYGNLGALEMGVSLKRLVIPKKKRIAQRKAREKALANNQRSKKIITAKGENNKIPDTTAVRVKSRGLKETLQEKQDSIQTKTDVGQIKHSPVILEKATLHFNFDFNSVEIKGESAEYLDELANVLKESSSLRITLIGHTDNVGSEKFNLRLSKERAQAVKDYLVSEGVSSLKIDVDGKGMQEPLTDNKTEETRAMNRRVELNIIFMEE